MNKMIRVCVAALLGLFPIMVQAQDPANDAEATELATNYFQSQHQDDQGGAVIAVLREGEIVFKVAYGMANLEYGIPNEVNTVFHAASLSKQFTAYSVLLLEQQGKLSMEDDIRDHLPEVPNFGKKITLKQLANHQSGLRDQWRLLHLAGWRPEDVILKDDIMELVARQQDLNFEPGTKVMYSNTGFTLLAEVVARVSGKTFATFTQEKIFSPLGMTNSQFYDDYQKVVKNRAYSYQSMDGVVKKHRLNFSTVGATSLFTTVVDLCKWAIHLNTLAETNPALAERMNQQATLNNGEVTESANGQWGGVKFKGLEWFDHSGSDASYRAYFSRFPESNSAAVTLANQTPVDAGNLALETADLFIRKFYPESEEEQIASTASITEREKTYQPVRLSNEELRQLCGKYWEPEERYDREIKLINDTLVYYRSESSQTRLLPVGQNEFKMLGDRNDVSVFFEQNEQGEATMRLNIDNKRTVNFVKYNTTFPLKDYPGRFFSTEVNNTLNVYRDGEHLHLKLFKGNPIKLQSIKKDLFKSSDRNFSKIEFIRNSKGKVTHLLVSNGGVVNLRFTAVPSYR